MSNNSHKHSPQALYISRLNVELFRQSQKQVKSIKLQIRNKMLKELNPTISPGGSHRETFIPALVLQPGDPFSILVQYRVDYQAKEVKITTNHREILSGAEEEGGIRMYQKTEEKAEVTVSLRLVISLFVGPRIVLNDLACSQLRSIANDIIQSCPRFRVLVIGNSGVGKTSLTHKLFGVDEICVVDDTRGTADIEQEFISKNQRFVLHDSEGFEEGDTDGIEIVKQFVKEHSDQKQIQDRLHAVWLCLDIPYAGARLLECGVEVLLRRRQEVLGDVPLVIVLTKVDLLDNQLTIDMLEGNSYGKTSERRKSEFLHKYCFAPIRKAAGDVPCVIVSAKVPHPAMFTDLMDVTQECINTYIGE